MCLCSLTFHKTNYSTMNGMVDAFNKVCHTCYL